MILALPLLLLAACSVDDEAANDQVNRDAEHIGNAAAATGGEAAGDAVPADPGGERDGNAASTAGEPSGSAAPVASAPSGRAVGNASGEIDPEAETRRDRTGSVGNGQ